MNIQLFGDEYDEFGMKAIDFWAFWDEQQGFDAHRRCQENCSWVLGPFLDILGLPQVVTLW